MIKCSIIISNYNYAKYLQKALDSALQQDFPAEQVEILLIDDASTDPITREFVQKYDHPRVRKILLEENVGIIRVRNLGIEQAVGEYILPLDADDWLEEDYVRCAVQVLDARPDLGLVYGLGELAGDNHGQWLQPFNLQTVLLEGGTPAESVYRKEVWRKVGGYHDYMKNGWEDWDFWLSVLEHGFGIESLTETVGFHYRIKRESRTAHAANCGDELWHNLYMHHQELYQRHVDVFAQAMYDAYLYRRLRYGFSYRIGKPIVKILRMIRRPFLPLIHSMRRKKKVLR